MSGIDWTQWLVHGDGSTIMQYQAKWPKCCHQNFNNAKLRHVEGKRQREEGADNPIDEDSCRTKQRAPKLRI